MNQLEIQQDSSATCGSTIFLLVYGHGFMALIQKIRLVSLKKKGENGCFGLKFEKECMEPKE